VEDLRGFYSHLIMFVLVNALLFVVDVLTPGGWWFYWPLFGWGIGVGIHAMSVFVGGPFGSQWEQRKIRQLMERDADTRPPAQGDGPNP
jgi:hypothetical protein